MRGNSIGLALATLFRSEQNAKTKKERATHFLPYLLGMQQRGSFCTLPEAMPFRRVWGAGGLTANLASVLHRRLIEEEPSAEPPFGAWYRVALGDIEAWLSCAVDDVEVERWAMRFSLFAWDRDSVAAVRKRLGSANQPNVQSGSLALFALFKPLFQKWLLAALLPEGSQREAAKVGPLPGIAAQLARSDVTAAVRFARTAYRTAGIEPAKIVSQQFDCPDPQRLLAALLIPSQRRELTNLSRRWLSPHRNNNHNS